MKLITATPWGVYSVWWRHFQVYRSTWLVNCLPPISEPIGLPAGLWLRSHALIGDVDYWADDSLPAVFGTGDDCDRGAVSVVF
jgi:hypothetical protein